MGVTPSPSTAAPADFRHNLFSSLTFLRQQNTISLRLSLILSIVFFKIQMLPLRKHERHRGHFLRKYIYWNIYLLIYTKKYIYCIYIYRYIYIYISLLLIYFTPVFIFIQRVYKYLENAGLSICFYNRYKSSFCN